MSQKRELFITTVVRTSDPTRKLSCDTQRPFPAYLHATAAGDDD
jgi:hypothetical protein